MVNSNYGWVDTGSSIETSPLDDNEEAVLVINIPFDTHATVTTSTEEGYDVFTIYDSREATIWTSSGEDTATVFLESLYSPYTFKYEKDGADFDGADKVVISSLDGIYPHVEGAVLPNKPTLDGSPFPYKVVVDYQENT
jgi:hypothetical protein